MDSQINITDQQKTIENILDSPVDMFDNSLSRKDTKDSQALVDRGLLPATSISKDFTDSYLSLSGSTGPIYESSNIDQAIVNDLQGNLPSCVDLHREIEIGEAKLEVIGPVSEGYINDVANLVNDLPPSVRDLLDSEEVIFVLSPYTTAYDSNLAGKTPNGYTQGTTFNSVGGLYRSRRNEIVLPEYHFHGNKPGVRLTQTNHLETTFHHEVGHGVNDALDNFAGNTEFIEAYNQDVSVMSDTDKPRFAYFVSNTTEQAGRSETFASVFAAMQGIGTSSGISSEDMLRQFPTVVVAIQNRLKEENQSDGFDDMDWTTIYS